MRLAPEALLLSALLWSWGVFAAPAAAQEPAPQTPASRGTVAAAVAAVDAARIEADVRSLVAFGTRHVLSRTDSETEGTGAARRWLRARFEAVAAAAGGRLEVKLQEQLVPCVRPGMPKEVPIVNVIATLRGTSDPERFYVVGGHYDSRNSTGEDGEGAAPGAVDDASGTAVALEACRAMAAHPFAATLVFVAYDAEEQGLLGSAAHAAALANDGARVDGMITCDIVGNTLGMDGQRYDRHVRCFSYAPSGNDSLGRSLARAATYAAATHVTGFDVKLILRGDRYGRGGDHRSFFDQGFPAVRFSEPREDFSRQHQDVTQRDGKPYGDVADYVDFAYTANVARVVVATLGELASAPPPPRVLRAQLRRDRYDTEIVYELPEGCESCEFVWRDTAAADWTHTVDMAAAAPVLVGERRWRATLSGVCLDDTVVGVRSLGKNGSRSRVAVPPEPDRFGREAQRNAPTAGPGWSGRTTMTRLFDRRFVVPAAALLLALAACEGGGSDIGPKLPPIPDASCKVVVLDDAGRGVVGARVTVGGGSALTGRNGRGDLLAEPRGRLLIAADGLNAAAVAGDRLGSVAFAANVMGPDLPDVIFLPDLPDTSSATLTIGTQVAPTAITSPAGNVLTVPAGCSVGLDGAATTVTVRTGDLLAQHVPGELPSPPTGALLTGRVFFVDPPAVTFTPAADLDVADDLVLGAATATLYHLDPTTGEWTVVFEGATAVAGRITVPGAVRSGGAYVFGAPVATATVTGRIVDVPKIPAQVAAVPDVMVRVDGVSTKTDGAGTFVASGVPATLADGSARSANVELFAGGFWLPARLTTTIAVSAGATADTGTLALDTEQAGNVRVQRILRGRAEALRPARISCVSAAVALATTSDAQGQSTFEDVPVRYFGFQEARPRDDREVFYGQSNNFLESGRRWLDVYQFLEKRAYYLGARNTVARVSDSIGGGVLVDAAVIQGSVSNVGFVGITDESGSYVVDRPFSGRATASMRTQRGGQTIVSAYSIERPDGEHIELALERVLRAPLGAFDRHGLVAGNVVGADPLRQHQLRTTRRLSVQEWWDDVIEGVPIPSSLPVDVDPALTHGPFQVGVAVAGGSIAVVELTAPLGVTTLENVGIAADILPQEGAAITQDIPLDLPATSTFTITGVLAGIDPLIDVTQMELSIGLLQPTETVVDVARGLRGNHVANGADVQLQLPALTGALQGNQWLAVLHGSFVSGAETLETDVFVAIDQAAETANPLLPFPVVTAPAPGSTVPASGFTVDLQLPLGTRFGTIELRSESPGEKLLWQALVPPFQTQFPFVALPAPAQTPLIAGRTYTLTVSAYFGDTLIVSTSAPYRDQTPFTQSLGPPERGASQVSRRSFQITTN